MRRRSVLIGCVPPTRSISSSWIARSSFACSSYLQIADLVEEERAARRELELAKLLTNRAGECALLVSEERALDELLGNRGEVHGHERRVRRGRTPDE